MNFDFLPATPAEAVNRGWTQPDFVLVSGDAYVDHPAFGTALIGRVLEREGYKVAILAQPDWRRDEDFLAYPAPKIGFLVAGGNVDSMVAHYTAAKKPRREDAYSPGGRAGKRPDRVTVVYTKILKRLYPDLPVIIGGLEASLRRLAHYDYWSDGVLPSVLSDSGADLLVYGMGERQICRAAAQLAAGCAIGELTDIPGTCYLTDRVDGLAAVTLPSLDKVREDKTAFARAVALAYEQQDEVRGKTLIQRQENGRYLVQNPPMLALTTGELDGIADLPFVRDPHPMYDSMGGVPAIEEVRFSIAHNRGCFGGCHFCAIAYHQGRVVTARSLQSVVREAERLVDHPDFKGYIHDVGGPTANFRHRSCAAQEKKGLCAGKHCLAPRCPNLRVDHTEYLDILSAVERVPGVKKVFIRSGLRFDYIMADRSDRFFKALVSRYVSGQLKVAPEHCSAAVLDQMGKPHIEVYKAFAERFYTLTKSMNKKQYLVPYLMSSHPGGTLKDAIELALFLKQNRIRPEQVQDFYPTPGTISTCMYYTGLNPVTMKPVFVPRTAKEKAAQRALLQSHLPQNRALVIEALREAGRPELIPLLTGGATRPTGGTPARTSGGRPNKPRRKAAKGPR